MRKTHRIYARDKNAVLDGLPTSKGTVEFGNKTAVYVDEDTAKEVDERYGLKSKDESVMVVKDEQYDRAVKGEGWKIVHDKRGDWVKTIHNYHFGPMTSKAAQDLWKRYEKKKKARARKEAKARKEVKNVSQISNS